MAGKDIPKVICPACNGSGEWWIQDPFKGNDLKLGLAYIGPHPCRQCGGLGKVSSRLFLMVEKVSSPIFGEQLESIATEVAQLEDLCARGVITDEDFSNAIQRLLES